MRFAALQGSGASDYINAGKAAADSAVKSFAINRKYSPDYGEIAKTGMKTRSAERVAATEAGAHVAKAGIKAFSDVNRVAINERAKSAIRDIKSKSRKAGGVAALGKVAAAGFLMRDNDKRKPPSNTAEKKAMWEKWKSNRDQTLAKRDANRTDYTPIGELENPPTNQTKSSGDITQPDKPAAPASIGTPTKGNAGKVATGDSSSPTSYDGSFASVYSMAKTSGARYPELVAAQWQLESASGTAISGNNNFFGIKAGAGESSTVKNTWEESGGSAYNTSAAFKNFDSPQSSVDELVSRWHQDYKGYKGVNNSGSAAEAAHSLRAQGYATDSKYATKLIDIMRRNGYEN